MIEVDMPKGVYKHKKLSEEHKKKIVSAGTGRKVFPETRQKISNSLLGHKGLVQEKNPSWKGDDASYSTKHKWIYRNYGSPTTCEHCQTNNLIGQQIHWCSIDHKYERDRTKWLRLCKKCHGLFDRVNKLRRHKK